MTAEYFYDLFKPKISFRIILKCQQCNHTNNVAILLHTVMIHCTVEASVNASGDSYCGFYVKL